MKVGKQTFLLGLLICEFVALGLNAATFGSNSPVNRRVLLPKTQAHVVNSRSARALSAVRDESTPSDRSMLIMEAVPGGIACRLDGVNTVSLGSPTTSESLRMHWAANQASSGGLTIIGFGTPQLFANPEAVAAIDRVIARWEAAISTPITIVIDFDFGTSFFGSPYPPFVVGAASSQRLSGNVYPFVREGLIQGASGMPELNLYSSLPVNEASTDIGTTSIIVSPSASFRALGLINPVADPVDELPFIGLPPAIGFNSNFPFDFDPTDRIDSDKIDFEGVIVHEIGHVLGFTSNVGTKELFPTARVASSVLDLFRFRPGVKLSTFDSSERILSSGGEQIFFAVGPKLPLSTGRPNGSGGDGAQASHWKDQGFGATQIGVMAPFIDLGARFILTEKDLRAIDAIGYSVRNSVLDD